LWPDVRPFAPALALALGASALSPVLEAAGVWVFKRVVDEVLVPHDLGRFPPLALLLTTLVLADAATGAADRLLSATATERFLVRLRTRVFRHILALPVAALERRPAGDLVTRLESDSDIIAGLLRSAGGGAAADVLRVVFFTAALAWLDARLACIALAALPLFVVAVRRFSARIRAAARDERRHVGGAASVAQEPWPPSRWSNRSPASSSSQPGSRAKRRRPCARTSPVRGFVRRCRRCSTSSIWRGGSP
jgi:ABC-type bacteriocin/lantibiotic exporter with double-glycine peptidase domain